MLGNDQIYEIKGIGEIKLMMKDEGIKILTEVRLYPRSREISYLLNTEVKGIQV